MTAVPFIRNDYNPNDMLKQVSRFVKAASTPNELNESGRIELAHTAISLLQTLPAARDAVLEYLCTIYDQAVNQHINGLDDVNSGIHQSADEETPLDETVQKIEAVLTTFINNNPRVWAPKISTWVIDLLGRLSGKYAERRCMPHGGMSINELLLMWMTCRPTKSLIQITSHCFTSLHGDTTDLSVDALIDASVTYSPHFDWVVAHIGTCFPATIISRVLSCGLRDFFLIGSSSNSQLDISPEENVHKLPSVVGILSHLANQHGLELRKSINLLFHASLDPDADEVAITAPHYLLHLASMSNIILDSLVQEFVVHVTVDDLNRLPSQLSKSRSHGPGHTNGLLNLIVHLLLKINDRSVQLIQLLLQYACTDAGRPQATSSQPPAAGAPSLSRSGSRSQICGEVIDFEEQMEVDQPGPVPTDVISSVKLFCSQIMNQLLISLQRCVHARCMDITQDINLLESLKNSRRTLTHQLMNHDTPPQILSWLTKLVSCLSIYCGVDSAVDIMSQLFMSATDYSQLSIFVQVLQEVHIRHPDILSRTLHRLFTVHVLPSLEINKATTTGQSVLNDVGKNVGHNGRSVSDESAGKCAKSHVCINETRQILNNLLAMCQWTSEANNRQAICSIIHSLEGYIHILASLLSSVDDTCVTVAMKLLGMLGISSSTTNPDAACLMSVADHVIQHFFTTLLIQDVMIKFEASHLCMRYIVRLCDCTPAAQAIVLKGLLEGATSKDNGWLFGTKLSRVNVEHRPHSSLIDQDSELLVENQNQRASTNSTTLMVFHSGVIGHGIRPVEVEPKSVLSKESVTFNRQLIVEVLWLSSCRNPPCTAKSTPMIPSGPKGTNGSVDIGAGGGERMTVDVSKCLAQMFVELVTPDVMYNGVAWPEEELIRFTLERDLMIRRKFDENPLLWDIMDLLATGPGAMRHCSCLLRSIMATLIGQWDMSRDRSAASQEELLITTRRIIEYLRKGQMLVEPLCYTGDILEFISSHEVFLLLMNLWKFLKENTSLPNMKLQGCNPRYTQVIHDILQANISQLGHLYSLFYVRISDNNAAPPLNINPSV